jgi:hypothetical protein
MPTKISIPTHRESAARLGRIRPKFDYQDLGGSQPFRENSGIYA